MSDIEAPVLLIWIVCVIAGGILGESKGHGLGGLIWTLLLGPLGLLIVACLPNEIKERQERRKDLALREQLELAREQVKLLQSLHQGSETPSAPQSTAQVQAPPLPQNQIEEFVPESLKGLRKVNARLKT